MDNNLVEKLAEQLELKVNEELLPHTDHIHAHKEYWIARAQQIISGMETPDTRLAIVRKVGGIA